MTRVKFTKDHERVASAAIVASIHVALGYALLTGLGFDLAGAVSDDLKIFDVSEDPPPPPAEPPPPEESKADRAKPKDAEGAASPANLRDTPSPIVAPPPEIRLEVPPPILAAPVAGQGNAPAAGAADIRGPGTGSGGQGTGLGSGGQGSGTGGGGGGGIAARWIKGSIRDSDYPRSAFEAGAGGTVYLRFIVGANGRVTGCTVTRSSGNAALDAVTCRLIMQRFRYRPARNARGKAVPDYVIGEHLWFVEKRPDIVLEEPDEEESY